MKFICVFLVLILVFSSFTSSKVSIRNKLRVEKGFLTNLWGFAVGAVGNFVRVKLARNHVVNTYKPCLREFLKPSGSADLQGLTYAEKGSKMLEKILTFKLKAGCVFGHCLINVLSDGLVHKVCRFANPIIKTLCGKGVKKRFFLQTNSHVTRHRTLLVLNRVSKGKGKKGILGFLKTAAASLFKPVLVEFNDWIIGFFRRIPIINVLIQSFECFSSLVSTSKKRFDGLKKALKLVMSGWCGFVKIIIKSICEWWLFKRAIVNLAEAFQSKGQKKWYLYGKFTGGLLAAMGDAKY